MGSCWLCLQRRVCVDRGTLRCIVSLNGWKSCAIVEAFACGLPTTARCDGVDVSLLCRGKQLHRPVVAEVLRFHDDALSKLASRLDTFATRETVQAQVEDVRRESHEAHSQVRCLLKCDASKLGGSATAAACE